MKIFCVDVKGDLAQAVAVANVGGWVQHVFQFVPQGDKVCVVMKVSEAQRKAILRQLETGKSEGVAT